MTKKNLFSVSLPLAKEICRMYWYVPAIAFILFFFSGIFPMISAFGGKPSAEWYIQDCLTNENIFYINILLCTPVVAAIMMMSFLHRESKAMMLHVQPLSKNRIFNTYGMTGLLMCIVPVLMMCIIYIIMMMGVPLFDLKDLIFWFASSTSIITFYYGITILAGTLTGTTVMNLLSTGVMIFIIPVLVLIAAFYCEIFMDGFYTIPEGLIEFAYNSGPIWELILAGEEMSVTECLLYFIVGLLLMAAASTVYKTRKLELVGTATLSKVFEEIMTVLVVFVGSSIFGLITTSFGESKPLMILGMAIGLAVCLICVKIVVNKTIKIFNKDILKSLVICVAAVAVFVSFTIFDFMGYSKKVPAVEDVKGIEVNYLVESYGGVNLNYGYASAENMENEPLLTSPESIKAVIELHKYIVSEGLYEEEYMEENKVTTNLMAADGKNVIKFNEYVSITYHLVDGSKMKRSFEIYLTDEVAAMLDKILTSEEYIENMQLLNLIDMDNVSYIQLTKWSDSFYDGELAASTQEIFDVAVINDHQAIEALLSSWDLDVETFGYTHMNRYITESEQQFMDVSVYFKQPSDAGSNSLGGSQDVSEEYISFTVTNLDKNTVAYLTELGYGDWVQ